MFRFSKYAFVIISLSLILIIPSFINGQLAGVPCICETTSLELTPMIKKPRIILISNPNNSSVSWEYNQEPDLNDLNVEEELAIESFVIPEPEPQLEPIKSSGNRTNIPRKSKTKNKIRLKKRGFKKYQGQCPVF